MSDAASIAASTGVPEEMVMRSALARAQANGTTVDEVLGAWGGGESIAAPPALSEAAASIEAPVESPTQATPEPVTAPALVERAASAPAEPVAPPVTVAPGPPSDAAPILMGRTDKPMLALAALVVLFAVGAMLAVGVAGLDAQNTALDQIPGTTPVLSSQAIAGRDVYLTQGCMYCHTQQVRSVVTDFGIGPVSEPGTSPAIGPPTLGFVRIGPDLAHIGSRTEDSADLRKVLADPRSVNPDSLMPSYAFLSEADLSDLVQYLEESK